LFVCCFFLPHPFPFSGTKRYTSTTPRRNGVGPHRHHHLLGASSKFYNPATVLTQLAQQMYRGNWFTNPLKASLVPGCAFGGAVVATGGGNFLRNIQWNMPAEENNHFFHTFFEEIQQNAKLLQETIVAYKDTSVSSTALTGVLYVYDPWNAETGDYDGFSKPQGYQFNEFNHWGEENTKEYLEGFADQFKRMKAVFFPPGHVREGEVKTKQANWWCPKDANWLVGKKKQCTQRKCHTVPKSTVGRDNDGPCKSSAELLFPSYFNKHRKIGHHKMTFQYATTRAMCGLSMVSKLLILLIVICFIIGIQLWSYICT